MKAYAGKPITDIDGNLTGFESILKIEGATPAPRGYRKLYGAATDFPIASEVSPGKWEIVEDTDAKDQYNLGEAQEVQEKSDAQVVKDGMIQLKSDIQNLSSVAGIKPILLAFWKAIAFLLKRELRR